MAESNVNIMLDTVRKNRVNIIYAVENDYGARFITATIMTDGKKKAVKKTAVVTINAERPDGQRKAFEGSVNEDGTVKVPVTQWMLEFEGEVVCSVSIVTSTSRLTTTHFYIQAQYSVWDGTSAPSADDPDKDVIVSIIAAENERVANENARIDAENARNTAEAARIDAENTRIAKESVRVSNEAERVSAESVRKTEFATWQGEIGKISAFDKRIENLEAAVTPGLVTPTVDESVAYQKDVPTGALPNAMISEVGGMSRKCENLFNENALADYSGIVKNGNGYYEGTSQKIQPAMIEIFNGTQIKENTVYSVCLEGYVVPETAGQRGIFIQANYTDGTMENLIILAETTNTVKSAMTNSAKSVANIAFSFGSANTMNYIKNICIREGTDTTYQPYFTGLRDAKVTAVESVGACLMSAYTAYNGVNAYAEMVVDGRNCIRMNSGVLFKTAPIAFKENTQYTASFETKAVNNGASTGNCVFAFFYTDGTRTQLNCSKDQTTFKQMTLTSDSGKTVKEIGVYVVQYLVYNYIDIDSFRFVEGTEVPVDCKPYFKNTFPIPEAVQTLEGYGQGVSKEYHNKIVLDSASGVKKFVRNVGAVDMGKQSYAYHSASNVFSTDVPIKANYTAEFLLNDYIKTDVIDLTSLPNMSARFSSTGITLWLKNTLYTNVEDFKASMQGVMLLYVLASPTETDISDYFDEDNLIGVEGGGTVTMVNEYEYDVPSVIEYTVKGSDAT